MRDSCHLTSIALLPSYVHVCRRGGAVGPVTSPNMVRGDIITASADAAGRAAEGTSRLFHCARAPRRPTDAPNMAIKRDVEQTEKMCQALSKKCKHWGRSINFSTEMFFKSSLLGKFDEKIAQ